MCIHNIIYGYILATLLCVYTCISMHVPLCVGGLSNISDIRQVLGNNYLLGSYSPVQCLIW